MKIIFAKFANDQIFRKETDFTQLIRETIIAVKLNEKDKIKINKKNLSKKGSPNKQKRGSVFQINDEDINDVYNISRKIGTGYFGTVKLAYPKSDMSKLYAVKSIDKSKLTYKKIQNLCREIEVLATLDHPNIVKYYETYNDPQYFHIITEYLSGGELFEKISKKKRFNEVEAASIIYKIASAIAHCHTNGIVHRDLKPENVLFENEKDNADIKIIDFGLSRKFDEDELHSIVGSPYYVAPEVLEGTYDSQCDVWGIGVIMYVLLCGKPPFFHENKAELFKKIKNEPLPFDHRLWKNISFEAVELIKSLLSKDPKSRPKAHQIIEFSWFNSNINSILSIKHPDPELIKTIHSSKQPGQLLRIILKIIAKEVKSCEIDDLNKMFMVMDKNKSGFIDPASFQQQQSFSLIQKTTTYNDNFLMTGPGTFNQNRDLVNYSTFVASALKKKNLLTRELLYETFKHLDIESTGFITVNNFDKALRRTGKIKAIDEIENMFKEYGFPKDVKLDFNEFCDFISKYL